MRLSSKVGERPLGVGSGSRAATDQGRLSRLSGSSIADRAASGFAPKEPLVAGVLADGGAAQDEIPVLSCDTYDLARVTPLTGPMEKSSQANQDRAASWLMLEI